MTTDATNDHLASGPRKNTQFGRQIGVDDTSPPEVAHGQRAQESQLIDNGHGGVKALFVKPMDHEPPAQEASEASEYRDPPTGRPTSNAALPDEGPSVWDASKAEGNESR